MKPHEHHIISRSPDETLGLGAFLGKYLTGGSVVALSGELGSGKTCLTAGIATGLLVPADFYVTSPSYVIVNEYPGRLRLFHVDLYRIRDLVELDDIGLDEIIESHGVTVIEWAEKMGKALPRERLVVTISIVDQQTRNFHLSAYGQSAVDLIEKCRLEFPFFQEYGRY
ncbi:MAG: tRNA (adenosine(37)-N6)-threonylcarbamoyltransferase complex ATPase subunit type 1 TsaE [Desulfobacterales bacterium]|nr:MAG: tRNA (adenosine(37)-N6)-threonylcarbamoyltransferase complex ATPase subunit type 1 TsaE [Desulfobacterales bacterium]